MDVNFAVGDNLNPTFCSDATRMQTSSRRKAHGMAGSKEVKRTGLGIIGMRRRSFISCVIVESSKGGECDGKY